MRERVCSRMRHIPQVLAAQVVSHITTLRGKLRDVKGQGTTEYAILVGVLVVIAIIAITVFRPKLEELWNAIADGISSL